MSHRSDLIATDIEQYLAQHERKDLLRFLTCGSVDDGKSTLIGRLLHDSKMIYEDQLAAVEADSVTMGSAGDEVDLALLMDGLKAEREQGITIDVAYRYFSTARRKFIIADTPGHEQYTRNMATGASTGDLAVILIDARHGVMTQTRRHSYIVSLLGIRHVVVAVNKMDLVDWAEGRFTEIEADYLEFARKIGVADPHVMPISALAGDNVVEPSVHMSWFDGIPMMEYLETVEVAQDRNVSNFRFPVQIVIRPDLSFRGYAGTITSGVVRTGDEVVVLPSGKRSMVHQIVTADGNLDEAWCGQAVTITLADELDVSRGDMLVHTDDRPRVSNQIDTMLVWMSEDPMVTGKQYLVRQASKVSNGVVRTLYDKVDVDTLVSETAQTLELNEIGRVSVVADQPLLWDPYETNRSTGAFILIDRLTNATVAAGMVLDRSDSGLWDVQAQESLTGTLSEVTRSERESRYGQKAVTVLLTGLSGAGKTTLGRVLERRLFELGCTTLRLDGQNMRLGISKDLGFSAQERSENMRRSAEVARLANDQGLIAVCAFVAPNNDVRERAKHLVGVDRFLIIHLDCPADICRERDRSGLYARADAGEIPEFPGVSSVYERPADPDLRLNTATLSVEECVDKVLALLSQRSVLVPSRGTQ